ncbi:MAG: hypothetical protein G01um101431_1031 [Parcubacteria group bacterium Gr01-1014_31]|nr:MAG: hypothetical protein G01um101431_1031 [Parcubacteria group bacterium Gr01-1014_31]
MPFKLPHLTNRQQVAVAGGALVFIAAITLLMSGIRPLGNPPATLLPSQIPVAGSTVSPAPGGSATPRTSPTVRPGTTPKPGALSYGDALAKYGDWRIQLNSKCQAQPPKMTVKTGTSILLDNRAPTPKTATLDGTVYKLAAYDFRIIRMTAATLPHTAILHCDPLKNVAQITIQK